MDQRNLKFISDNSLSYFPMSGSYFQKLKKFQKIIKEEETSIILSYLTLANFVSGISKILHRNIVTIGGIRNEKLPYYKFIFEKLIHNYLNDATVFNNYSAKEKFEKKGFNPEKIYVIQNAIDAASLNLNSEELKWRNKNCYCRPVCKAEGLWHISPFIQQSCWQKQR